MTGVFVNKLPKQNLPCPEHDFKQSLKTAFPEKARYTCSFVTPLPERKKCCKAYIFEVGETPWIDAIFEMCHCFTRFVINVSTVLEARFCFWLDIQKIVVAHVLKNKHIFCIF